MKAPVALRKESVDRNAPPVNGEGLSSWSLSARRAWIEITNFHPASLCDLVALRKESVDRNSEDWLNAARLSRSLSARRAWIEIHLPGWLRVLEVVALRKESVDRNFVVCCIIAL